MPKNKISFFFLFSLLSLITVAAPSDSLVRLILFGGAREINAKNEAHLLGIQHNNTFGNAAYRLKKEYLLQNLPGVKIKVVQIETGAEVVHILNKQKTKAILSVDFITHSDMPSLNMSYAENTNCGIYTDEKGKRLTEKIHHKGYHFVEESRSIDDIDLTRFSDTVKIEFHGCRTAGNEFFCPNISHYLSRKFAEAGKSEAIVIGHKGKSEVPMKENGKLVTDYRHKWRIVYRNGRIIFNTHKMGDIFPYARKFGHKKKLKK